MAEPQDGHTRQAAAFFDLDRTLISGSSAFYFGIAAWRNDMISGWAVVKDALSALAFRIVGASDEKSAALRDRILESVEGSAQADLIAINEDITPEILKRVRPEAKGLIEMHQQADRDCWIVSASPVEVVDPVAKAMGMKGGIGTVSEVVDGRYTGELVGPFTYGVGKAEAIEKIAAESGYDLQLCYSYSDSISDVPMLELVGHPVAVNPDGALESLARQRGWPVVIFARRAKVAIKTTTAGIGAAGLATGTYLLGRRHGRIQSEASRGRRLLQRLT